MAKYLLKGLVCSPQLLIVSVIRRTTAKRTDGIVGGGGSTVDDTTAASVAVSTENVQNDVIELMTALRKDSYHQRQMSKTQQKRNEADSAKRHAETNTVKRTLAVTLDLCEWNSQKSSGNNNDDDRHHSSQLWFNVLDHLINAKSFLRLLKELPHHSAPVKTLLSELLQLTVQRMIGHVPLMDLVKKITTGHAGSRLGEFRDMMGKMLEIIILVDQYKVKKYMFARSHTIV